MAIGKLSVWLTAAGSLLLLGSSWLFAKPLPPLGQRVYVIEKENSPRPVEIKQTAKVSVGQVTLKDPKQPSFDRKVSLKSLKQAPLKPSKNPAYRPAQLNFRTLSIAGKSKKPSVQFNRENLPLFQVEQKQTADFYEKVFDPLKDRNF